VRALDFERLALEYLMQLVRNPAYMSLCYRCKNCEHMDVYFSVKCKVHGNTYAKLKCTNYEKENGVEQARYGTTD
jgi:hypothetical protein